MILDDTDTPVDAVLQRTAEDGSLELSYDNGETWEPADDAEPDHGVTT